MACPVDKLLDAANGGEISKKILTHLVIYKYDDF